MRSMNSGSTAANGTWPPLWCGDLHRPSNVDDETTIRTNLSGIGKVAERIPLVFAVHPRTSAMLDCCGIEVPARLCLSPPLRYMAFLSLWSRSTLMITDSGGL